MSPDCPFCGRIARSEYDGSRTGPIVHFTPINPVTPGHRLFVPRGHAEHPSPVHTSQAMLSAAEWGEEEDEDFNLIVSSGADATQTVPHIHVHYIPRRPDDGLTLPWAKH